MTELGSNLVVTNEGVIFDSIDFIGIGTTGEAFSGLPRSAVIYKYFPTVQASELASKSISFNYVNNLIQELLSTGLVGRRFSDKCGN